MTKSFTYKTQGVCAREIVIEVVDDIIESVKYIGGCSGNTQGVAALVKGMSVDEAIERLSGIKCGFKATSCPDQLAKALKEAK
ncbi:MAG: TIGR03905 family TSCPD domain-containing protein [Clostridia bacterium]|jgi:uncharacterized protein (TIGR03905 family)|nr:TIGR03905 family TSCPD domain-containing protein [Clostridia bacterium]